MQTIVNIIFTATLTLFCLAIAGVIPFWVSSLPILIPTGIVFLFYSFISIFYCFHPKNKFDFQAPWNNQETWWWFVEYHGRKWRGELDKE